MSEYRLGKLARQDLRDIWNYIADDNPDAADRMVELIISKFATLAASPGFRSARSESDGSDIRCGSGNAVSACALRKVSGSLRPSHGTTEASETAPVRTHPVRHG